MATKLSAITNPLFFVRNHRFIQQIALLGSGTAIAQIANIAATPLLATLYDPAHFGSMAIYMGLVLIVGSMASLTYESAILLPKSDRDALALLKLCFVLTATTALLLLVVLASLQAVSGDGGVLVHWTLIFWLPLGVLTLGAFNAASQWSIREDHFKKVSVAIVIRSTGAALVQIVGGLVGAATVGLVLGRVLGQSAATAFIMRSNRLSIDQLLPRDVASLKRVASTHFRFPVFKAPQNVIVLLSDQMPAFALATAFGATYAGLYWMADRILTLPSTVISEATSKAFYRECVRRQHSQVPMWPLFFKTMACLFLAALLPSMVVFAYAPDVFGLLGDEWRLSGYYAQWLVIRAFFKFTFSPVMAIYMITDQQARLLTIDMIAICGRVIIFVLAFFLDDPIHFVMVICLFESAKILLTVIDIAVVLRRFEAPGKKEHHLDVGPEAGKT